MKKKLTILAAFLLALPVSAQTDGELEQMVEQTLRQMTLEEKSCQVATLYGSGRVI